MRDIHLNNENNQADLEQQHKCRICQMCFSNNQVIMSV